MKNAFIIVGVVVIVAGVALYRNADEQGESVGQSASQPANAEDGDDLFLPRMVDFGSDKCVACKKMAPVLEKLRKQYAGRANIEFIDVYEHPSSRQLFNVRLIPTQIFYDAEDEEVWRHEGLLLEKEIVAKLREMGVKEEEAK